jgi:membrane fusion protein, multidrug efflux system
VKPWMKWGLGLAVVLGCGGLIARAIMARQHERAQITQSAASTQAARLLLQSTDLIQARQGVLVQTLPVSGTLEAVHSALVKSRVSGELKTMNVLEGAAVSRGQVLAILDDREHRQRYEQASQQVASAKAQWDIARRARETNQNLVAQGFISRTALDNSESNAMAAQANLLAAKAAQALAWQSLDDARITSPISGTVARRLAQRGERVAPESPLVEIVDLSAMEMEVSLRPQDVGRIRPGTLGTLRAEGVADALSAKVVRINPAADPATRTVKVYLALQPHPALRQGLYAQGHLSLSEQAGILVPRASVRHEATGDFVQLVRDGVVRHQAVNITASGLLAGADARAEPLVSLSGNLRPGEPVLKGTLGVLADGTAVEVGPSLRAPRP